MFARLLCLQQVLALPSAVAGANTATRLQLRQKPKIDKEPSAHVPVAGVTMAGAAAAAPAAVNLHESRRLRVSPLAANPFAPAGTPAPEAVGVRPQVFFLFMVYHKINNEAVWDRFFQEGMYGYNYQALVHCKDEAKCRKTIRSSHFDIIHPVATEWCSNLVDGMNQLLKVALLRGGSGSPHDKFAFLSDSSLPAKSFGTIWSRLTTNTDSDFCIFPRNEWAQVSDGLPGGQPVTVRVAVKHHQWMVLSRKHAEMSVLEAGKHMDLMNTWQLNLGYANTGCLDEFWHFKVAFPDLHLDTRPFKANLQNFGGQPLSTTNYEIQGRCDTYVHWVQRASGISNNITILAKELAEDVGTDSIAASQTHPASYRGLSRGALIAMRTSDFLFVRKIEDSAGFSGCEKLEDAFGAIVFAPSIQPLPSTTKVWPGDGVWLDNRQSPVAITSLHGAARLVGADEEMQAKGHYCGDTLYVTFGSGFQASATLSKDNHQLHWDNGVVWPRSAKPGMAVVSVNSSIH